MKMRHSSITLALLSILTPGTVQSIGQQQQAPDQPQAQQPAGASPHEFNSDDQVLDLVIKSELGKGHPQGYSGIPVHVKNSQAYSNVAVQVTDTEIVLTGTVRTSSEKDRVAKIAAAHAGERKIVNQLEVNPQ
jgi:hypothetical protein